MATEYRELPLDGLRRPMRPGDGVGPEPSLGELFGQLSSDAGQLIRQEVALAKAELREAGSTLAKDGTKIGIALGLGLLGGLAATAFLIMALGDLLDNYWLSALIVSALLLGIAALLGKGAMDDIKRRRLAPQETINTLREDVEWAKHEARGVKREWTS